MIGIILAGGKGTRLYPSTKIINKHLINIYDKPMIYYPVSLLILLGIKKIFIVTNKKDLGNFKTVLKVGKNISINYIIQEKSAGIVDALKICLPSLKFEDAIVLLGDNFIYGSFLINNLKKIFNTNRLKSQALTFFTNRPQLYGVLNNKKTKVIEKPQNYKSGLAVIGVYFFKNKYLKYLNEVKKSKNGEFEISSYLNLLIRNKQIEFNMLSRSINWWDCGSFEDIYDASTFVKNTQKVNGYKIADLKEVAKTL